MITQTQREYLDSLNQGNARRADLNKALDRSEKVVALLYDFSVSGGATADYNLTDIDGNTYATEEACVVTKIIALEQSALTSGGSATVQLKAGSTNLSDAEAFDTGFTGADSLALASSATAIAVATGQTLKITVAGAALTAGKVIFYVYMVPQRTN